MKTRRFKIKIQTSGQAKEEFIKAWHLTEKGHELDPGYDLVLSFPNLSSISKVLSPEQISIIQTIRDKKPESIRQLAKLLVRAQSNVQKDVQELAELGILELKSIQKDGNKRKSLQPIFEWDGFDIAV